MIKSFLNKISPMSWVIITVTCCILINRIGYFLVDIRSYSTPSHAKRYVQESVGAQFLWSQNIHSSPLVIDKQPMGGKRVFIPITNGQLILPAYKTRLLFSRDEWLISFNPQTGIQEWELMLNDENSSRLSAIASNEGEVFVFMSEIKGADSYIIAVDSMGQINWKTYLSNLQFIAEFYADETKVNYRGHGLRNTNYSEISFDVSTGKQIPYISLNFKSSPMDYHLLARRLGYEEVISGFVHENLLFLLVGKDSSVLILDWGSGDVVGKIVFDNIPITWDGIASFDIHYSNGFLSVYFGDSHQLFVFQFVPPATDQ